MTGLPSYQTHFYRCREIIVLDAQQRLPYNFVVIAGGYHEFKSIYAARKFIRGLG
jgi:hypothetical protein